MNDGTRGQAFTGQFDAATTRILPSSLVTHVHLLRHGEVAELTKRVVRGQMDVPLSPRGRAESTALACWLEAHEPRPDVVYTSDLVRCTELAADLARRSGRVPIVDSRLREQSMGAWEGRTWAEITAAEPRAVTAYWDDYYAARPTNGESFADLERRVLAWWNEMLAAHAGQRIFVATHIGVIRVLVSHALGSPPNQALRFAPATASHTAISVGEAGAVVAQAGERPWMFAGFDAGRETEKRIEGSVRIGLSGSAGTGKTTLGRRLAQELGVPFLDEIMRRRIESGFDFHGMTPAGWRDMMREQWEEQRALEDAARDGFVADRSSLDYAAFFLHYDLHVGVDAEPWMRAMFEAAQRYDRILLFPWGALPLEDDGVRTTNRWTQLRFQTILEGLVERFSPARVLRVPATDDFEQRVAFAMRSLGR
jgi:broad specificity phosphatase PhoE/nicotinamide riboside kinase